MYRVVFASYLLVLSLTGPSPCCCTLARVAAAVGSWTGIDQSRQWDSCCCSCPISGTASRDLSGGQHQHPTKPCQCERLCSLVPSEKVAVPLDHTRVCLDSVADVSSWTMPDLALRADRSGALELSPPETQPSGRALRIALGSWLC